MVSCNYRVIPLFIFCLFTLQPISAGAIHDCYTWPWQQKQSWLSKQVSTTDWETCAVITTLLALGAATITISVLIIKELKRQAKEDPAKYEKSMKALVEMFEDTCFLLRLKVILEQV